MEEVFAARLIEAGEYTEAHDGFFFEIVKGGIRVMYAWKGGGSPDHDRVVEKFVTWEIIKTANVNPIIQACNSLTKQAGVLA